MFNKTHINYNSLMQNIKSVSEFLLPELTCMGDRHTTSQQLVLVVIGVGSDISCDCCNHYHDVEDHTDYNTNDVPHPSRARETPSSFVVTIQPGRVNLGEGRERERLSMVTSDSLVRVPFIYI